MSAPDADSPPLPTGFLITTHFLFHGIAPHVRFDPFVFHQDGKYFRGLAAEMWVRAPSFTCSCVG